MQSVLDIHGKLKMSFWKQINLQNIQQGSEGFSAVSTGCFNLSVEVMSWLSQADNSMQVIFSNTKLYQLHST